MNSVTLRAACLVAALALAPGLAFADERLLGSWVGTGPGNQGAQVTVEADAVTIGGERLPLRFVSPGLVVIGSGPEASQLRYEVQGDVLLTVDEDGRASWRRVKAPRPPQPRPPVNPLGDAPSADPFVRSFSGDGLTLTLTGASSEGYTGTLTRGAASYPVTARAEGSRLAGTFAAGGNRFEFTATLKADRLTLVSGGATYQLAASPQASSLEGGGGTPTPKPAASPEGPVVMVQHTVRDKGVGNMESHTLLAPKGWRVEGGAWWARVEYFSVLPSRDIKVIAPDGRQVHLAPSVVARDIFPPPQLNQPRPREGTADKGVPVIYMPQSLEAWRAWIKEHSILKTYPGATDARVTNAVVVPELTAMLNKQIEWRRRMIAQQAQLDASVGMRSFIDAKVYAFECSYTHEGRAWEELILFGTTYQGFESQLLGRTITWDVNPAVVYRAPAGMLEASMPLLVAIVNTLRPTPQWSRMCAEHQAKLAGIAAEGARKANQAAMERSRILAQTNSEISDIIAGGHKNREAIRDATHRKVINSISGVNDYVVPGGTTSVQLPDAYQRVFTNGNGEYLLTNDLLYDPNTDATRNTLHWTGMQPRR